MGSNDPHGDGSMLQWFGTMNLHLIDVTSTLMTISGWSPRTMPTILLCGEVVAWLLQFTRFTNGIWASCYHDCFSTIASLCVLCLRIPCFCSKLSYSMSDAQCLYLHHLGLLGEPKPHFLLPSNEPSSCKVVASSSELRCNILWPFIKDISTMNIRKPYTVGPPSHVCACINPSNHGSLRTIHHTYWSY